jgi:hypothetical protein
MPRKRSEQLTFLSTPSKSKIVDSEMETETQTPQLFHLNIPKIWVLRFSVLFTIFIALSPWIFLMLKNNSLSKFSNKVTEFYDDNFSCNSYVKEHMRREDGKELKKEDLLNKF